MLAPEAGEGVLLAALGALIPGHADQHAVDLEELGHRLLHDDAGGLVAGAGGSHRFHDLRMLAERGPHHLAENQHVGADERHVESLQDRLSRVRAGVAPLRIAVERGGVARRVAGRGGHQVGHAPLARELHQFGGRDRGLLQRVVGDLLSTRFLDVAGGNRVFQAVIVDARGGVRGAELDLIEAPGSGGPHVRDGEQVLLGERGVGELVTGADARADLVGDQAGRHRRLRDLREPGLDLEGARSELISVQIHGDSLSEGRGRAAPGRCLRRRRRPRRRR